MARMKIKAPINSLNSALMQLNSGADELYVGLDFAPGDYIAFSARATRSFDGTKTNVTDSVLAEICKVAHQRGATVELTANSCIAGSDPDFGKTAREQYLRYVQRGIAAGVDGVIVGDLGNLVWLRENDVKTNFTASVHFVALNRYHLMQLHELGVSAVVVPHHMKIEEIAALVSSTPMKIIAFGHLGCSFIEATCSLLHEMNEKTSVGIPCRARWTLPATGEKACITSVAEDCSICVLDKLMKAGVHSVKIIGRELNPGFIAAITRAYSMAIRQFEQGADVERVKNFIIQQLPWWKSSFCDPKKCKYMFNSHYM